MKRRLLLPLIICALVLSGCYRQAEEPIQQVSGSQADPTDAPFTISTPVVAVEAGEASDAIDVVVPTATSPYITPESLPGQVEQPTIVIPTTVIIVPTTSDASSTRVFILPTPTLTFAEQLNPSDECVYSVLPGDTLFRLSLVYATTVEEFFAVNQLDSDALSIGQLLRIPGCEASAPSEPVDAPTAEPSPAPVQQEGPVVADPEEIIATDVAVVSTPILPEGPPIHVVSAGETLVSIALRYDIAVEDILDANDLEEGEQIAIGQELVIPDETDTAAEVDGNDEASGS